MKSRQRRITWPSIGHPPKNLAIGILAATMAFTSFGVAASDSDHVGSWVIRQLSFNDPDAPIYEMFTGGEGRPVPDFSWPDPMLGFHCTRSGKIFIKMFRNVATPIINPSIMHVLVNGELTHFTASEDGIQDVTWYAEAELSKDESLAIVAAVRQEKGDIVISASGMKVPPAKGIDFVVNKTDLAFESLMAACEAAAPAGPNTTGSDLSSGSPAANQSEQPSTADQPGRPLDISLEQFRQVRSQCAEMFGPHSTTPSYVLQNSCEKQSFDAIREMRKSNR